jgi:hypothetical protein
VTGLSIRTRVTAWNVAMVALVLIAAGTAVRYVVRERLTEATDRNLREHAQRLLEPFSRFGPPHGGSPSAPGQAWAPADFAEGGPPGPPGPMQWLPPGALFTRRFHDAVSLRIFGRDGGDLQDGKRVGPWDAQGFATALLPKPTARSVVAEGEELRVFSQPAERDRHLDGVIQAAEPLAPTQRALAQLTQTLLLLLPVALFLAAAGGAFLTARALRPVRDLTNTARRIKAD